MSRLLSSKILKKANLASKGKILTADYTDNHGCFEKNLSREFWGAHAPLSEKGRIRSAKRTALRALARRSPPRRGGFSKRWNANSRVCHRASVFGVFGGGVEQSTRAACAAGTSYRDQPPIRRSVGEG